MNNPAQPPVPRPPTIEILLDRVARQQQQQQHQTHQQQSLPAEPTPPRVTLNDFLDANDILAECSAVNGRLLDYFTRDDCLIDLVTTAVAPLDSLNHSALSCDSLGMANEDDTQPDNTIQHHAFIASEILASEGVRISKCLVDSHKAMSTLLHFLLSPTPEDLDPRLATYCTKILTALLRCRHAETVATLGLVCPDGSLTWLDHMVAHVPSEPVAELLVRVLDGPDTSATRTLGSNPVSVEGVELYAKKDIFQQLGDQFIQSAMAQQVLSKAATPLAGEALVPSKFFHLQIANSAQVFEGLTSRILRMPLQGDEVQPAVNLYSVPWILGKMIDAGLTCLPHTQLPLNYALRTVTFMMTTDANIAPSQATEEARVMQNFILGMSPPGRRNTLGASPLPARNASSQRRLMATDRLENNMWSRIKPLALLLNRTDEPVLLGSTRLTIVEFFVALLRRGNDETIRLLDESKIPRRLLDLFIEFESSSILHNVITEGLVEALGVGQCATTEAWFSADFVSKMICPLAENDQSDPAEQPSTIAQNSGSDCVQQESNVTQNNECGSAGEHTNVAKISESASRQPSNVAQIIQIADAANKFLSTLQPDVLAEYLDGPTSSRFFEYVSKTLTKILAVQNEPIGGSRGIKPLVDENELADGDEDDGAGLFDANGFYPGELIEGLVSNNHEAITMLAQSLFRGSTIRGYSLELEPLLEQHNGGIGEEQAELDQVIALPETNGPVPVPDLAPAANEEVDEDCDDGAGNYMMPQVEQPRIAEANGA